MSNVVRNDLQEDKKYTALIIGGSFLISLVTIITGHLLANTNGSFLSELGYGVTVLGYTWVLGTFLMGLYIQARMNQFKKELQTIRVDK